MSCLFPRVAGPAGCAPDARERFALAAPEARATPKPPSRDVRTAHSEGRSNRERRKVAANIAPARCFAQRPARESVRLAGPQADAIEQRDVDPAIGVAGLEAERVGDVEQARIEQ